MNSEVEHPSFLALDGLRWGGGTEAQRTHVAGCAVCAAHLEQMSRPVDVPAWARALEHERPRGWRSLWAGGRGWAWGSALVGVGAALLLVVSGVRSREELPGPYVGIKGTPVVVVHVRHGQSVAPWDDTRTLVPGDSLRLEVAASGYPQVVVGSPTADGGFQTLYTGVLPEGGEVLPASWRVDAEGEREQLVVVLSRAPLSPEALRQALAERSHTAEVWVTELQLPKQPTP
ncbi:hypothetical protein [Hyalangium versicolor]|uniref:hypothetical protein n=1 Tax=Hyalangium versicolor TaxID=2861190 RepID=UPI001CCD3179|nr:hypothetical protein [Hyalangium versicolor]